MEKTVSGVLNALSLASDAAHPTAIGRWLSEWLILENGIWIDLNFKDTIDSIKEHLNDKDERPEFGKQIRCGVFQISLLFRTFGLRNKAVKIYQLDKSSLFLAFE